MASSFAQFRLRLYAPALGTLLALTSCATLPPPTAELGAAQQALQLAESADADQYAPQALTAARAALQQAQAAMARGRDSEAREAALEASTSADLARVRSRAAQLRAELLQRGTEVHELQSTLGSGTASAAANPLDIPVPAGDAAQRLQALDADARLNAFAQYERMQARTALAAVAAASRRAQAPLQARAQRRVEIAEQAARIGAAQRELDRLGQLRSELLIEASRRDAERARAEAERLRMQAQVRAEEDARTQAQQADAVLDDAQSAQQAKVEAARAKEAALARQEAELVAGAKLPPMRQAAEGEVFTLGGEAFASGQSQLTKSASASLNALGAYVAALGDRTVSVVGHTDSQGNPDSNRELSERRAQQVRAALIAAGLKRASVNAQGRGASAPVADNATAAGRAKNRRVEITVSGN